MCRWRRSDRENVAEHSSHGSAVASRERECSAACRFRFSCLVKRLWQTRHWKGWRGGLASTATAAEEMDMVTPFWRLLPRRVERLRFVSRAWFNAEVEVWDEVTHRLYCSSVCKVGCVHRPRHGWILNWAFPAVNRGRLNCQSGSPTGRSATAWSFRYHGAGGQTYRVPPPRSATALDSYLAGRLMVEMSGDCTVHFFCGYRTS